MMVVGFGGAWLSRRRRRARAASLPACGMRACATPYAHTHAPGTGWIRPDSWDYENNCPRVK
jgi:hypothetical protein